MTPLQAWMDKTRLNDRQLAERVKDISRVQIFRVRTGRNGASKRLAMKLQKVTGIPWHEFIGGVAQ